ncbi:tRNA-(guanine-N1)-methyltransferase [Loktanella sp. D2R18]|uniref:nitrite reductase (NAD(P)H) small subunit n=1 Tax=Rhodobacterales TaxID=204455 RepID=UPI000DEA37ED|nr:MULTISPECIES: nitrite reductase (NAD(P)H) small subunit [Rhodobacterales]MDO6589272.1 nitrite reductase (NAD(P)H) small subunit [Yoonia sp. 1_MG-2023]RBW45306.1 tRNA-(guanine-N1)-methyltransferase [Loktanella sp. D2R18]
MTDFIDIGSVTDIPVQGARLVRTQHGDIAIFHTASGKFYAVDEYLPGKAGPLSNGIQHGEKVTDPMRNWVFDLATGEAQGADEGCVGTYEMKVEEGRLLLSRDAIANQVAAE